MKELKEKAQALIDKYTPELSSKGLKILLSKRYFESNVSERSSGYYAIGTILNSIDRVRDHKEEKENGYNYVKTDTIILFLLFVQSRKTWSGARSAETMPSFSKRLSERILD